MEPKFPSLADEIAEPLPDMNIKVTAFTVKQKLSSILRKTIEGYLDSEAILTFNTMKTLLITHAFHSSRHLQSKWMLYFSHASMV